MIDVKFRRMMLEHPQIVQKSILSELERNIANYVHRQSKPVFSPEVAGAFGITVPNASVRLATLCKKGYLVRCQVTAPSGGCEYEYLPAFSLKEDGQ